MKSLTLKNQIKRVRFKPKASVYLKPPRPLDNSKVRQLFASLRPTEIGAVALAVFAGIRSSELESLPADCVNVKEKRVTIPSCFAKAGKEYCLSGIADTLWCWLEVYPYQPIKSWPALVKRIRKTLGENYTTNCLRQNAILNSCALDGIAATALRHHMPERLFAKHFTYGVSAEVVAAFFSIKPGCLQLQNAP